MIDDLKRRIMQVDIVGVMVDAGQILSEFVAAVSEGVTSLLLIPVCIPHDKAMLGDLNDLVNGFLEDNPGVEIEIINEYTNSQVLVDNIWESIVSRVSAKDDLPALGRNIETLSHLIIDTKLKGITSLSLKEKIVARRIIHATADYSFADTIRFSSGAVSKGIEALKNKAPIICDVNMLKTAMTKVESEIICAITEPEVIELAREQESTRAAAAMLRLSDKLEGAIVVIGNAPTAIWQLLKMEVKPAVVIGLPVGFVGAREAKLELIKSEHEYIANVSPRGGSPAAAAALNALALLARENTHKQLLS